MREAPDVILCYEGNMNLFSVASPLYNIHPPLPSFPSHPPQVLEKGGPYPQVILPQFGGYWIEDAEAPLGTPTSSDSSFCEEEDWGEGMSPGGGFGYRLECNSMARAYRKHFLGRVSFFLNYIFLVFYLYIW